MWYRDRPDLSGQKLMVKSDDFVHQIKEKIIKTSILNHFDPDRSPVIVVYASK